MTTELQLRNSVIVPSAQETALDHQVFDAQFADETFDESGEGVSVAEIARWQEVAKRFGKHEWDDNHRYGFKEFPFAKVEHQFLAGEQWRGGNERVKENDENNPLQLIRPENIWSVKDWYAEKGQKDIAEKLLWQPGGWPRERPDLGSSPSSLAGAYEQQVKNFEVLATTVLVSLNQVDSRQRMTMVGEKLSEFFSKEKIVSQIQDRPKTTSKEDTHKWLVYTVLSIVNSPSPGITALGRLRALELLSFFNTKELAVSFQGQKDQEYSPGYNKKKDLGYERFLPARLPQSFCSREERLEPDHGNLWQRNQKLQALIVRDKQKRIDWQATAVQLTQRSPAEAIQICLLLLRDPVAAEGALAYLAAIPRLETKSKSIMLGRKSSLFIELKLTRTLEEQVAQGIGIKAVPGSDIEAEMEAKDANDLRQIIRRQQQTITWLEEQLARTTAGQAKMYWEMQGARGETFVEKEDPQGYFRILGLHPHAFDGLDEKTIQDMLKRQNNFYLRIYHSDLPENRGNLQAATNLALLTEALNLLSNPVKRLSYGK